MHRHDRLYIDGAWVPSTGPGSIDVINSTTEQVIGSVPEGTPEDIDRAVAAAKAAFGGWSSTTVEERAKSLCRIQEGLQARVAEIGNVIAAEVGMPVNAATVIQAGLPTITFSLMAQLLGEVPFEEPVLNSIVVREPVGVVGAIAPWNYPLHQIAAKVAPALAAGCTVVLKPSEVAPLNAYILTEVIDDAGLPPGVFNLVTGYGPVVGEALAAHSDIDMISFTGSLRVGRRVAELAARTVKRVALELGGKSPSVILDDADLSRAVRNTVTSCFLNSGQSCTSLTRMLVPRSRLAEAETLAVEEAQAYVLGDPLVEGTRLGPLVSAGQRDRVRAFIQKGVDEGARLLIGGAEPPEGLEEGYFVRPTVFSEVRSDMTIAQEEIFGPVLSILPYETEDEAVRIANDTIYGLAGAVWSGDADRALRVARQIRTGSIAINGGDFNPLAPLGGYKQSGVGREFGRHGLEEYLEVKSLQL